VIEAVPIVTNPIPTSMTNSATDRPAAVVGTLSPWQTVRYRLHSRQSPLPTEAKFSWSMIVMSRPAARVMENVTRQRGAPRV
jgi:hypothetical protein